MPVSHEKELDLRIIAALREKDVPPVKMPWSSKGVPINRSKLERNYLRRLNHLERAGVNGRYSLNQRISRKSVKSSG